MSLDTVFYDFETYYSTEFSLTRLNFIEYIKSPQFEVISVSVKINDGPTIVRFGEEAVGELLKSIDWSNAIAVAHNGNEFDHAVLVWRFDCHPRLFADTLAMARPRHQSVHSLGLGPLSTVHNLPAKRTQTLLNMRGKRYMDLSLEEMVRLKEYNDQDTENCASLYGIYKPTTSKKEMLLADMTARMALYPQFHVDVPALQAALAQVKLLKEQALQGLLLPLGVESVLDVKAQLASQKKFADALRRFGVEPPLKVSKATGKVTFALSKTDDEFLALQEHEDPNVQALVAARLGVRSTLLETRLERMIAIGECMGGWMPIPLAYHAATTGRWGGRVLNAQNFPRIGKVAKLTDALRRSLVAPPGYKVVASDLSGIELRVNHYLWQVPSTATAYASDPEADLYVQFAAEHLYYKPEVHVSKDERQLAKVAQLGLGFGAGAATFMRVAKQMGGIKLTMAEAQDVVAKWRLAYREIGKGWKRCAAAIYAMKNGQRMSIDPRGLVTTGKDHLTLPSGRVLHYPGLWTYHDADGRQVYRYGTGTKESFITGPRLDENIVQAIARDVIAEHALAIWGKTGRFPALTVHDELVYVVPEDEAETFLARVNAVMRTPPAWLPDIVLWSEGGVGDTYGEVK